MLLTCSVFLVALPVARVADGRPAEDGAARVVLEEVPKYVRLTRSSMFSKHLFWDSVQKANRRGLAKIVGLRH